MSDPESLEFFVARAAASKGKKSEISQLNFSEPGWLAIGILCSYRVKIPSSIDSVELCLCRHASLGTR